MEQLVNFIIRPPRADYDPNHDLLDQEFMLKGKLFQRKDIEVRNSRDDVLQCSHYVPIISPDGKPLPCVIYCHGNSGCRADASEAAIILLPSNITVFTLDFSGSGLSGGEHVSLGWYEKDDLKAVVDYLRSDGNVSLIGLWGRSMGAVTSLMYGAEDPSIAGMVIDSPFSDLNELMMELVDTYKYRLPKFTVKYFIQFMRKAIMKKANFDIMELNTIKVAKLCFVPALFGHATDDEFIRPHHSDRIFEAYEGDKNIIKFEGDHNSPRPQFYFDSINIFFHNILQPPEDEVGESYLGAMHDYFDKSSWDRFHDFDYADFNHLGPSSGTASNFVCSNDVFAAEVATSSTEDANQQPHPKRPMSRMEVPHDVPCKDELSKGQGVMDEKEAFVSSSEMISLELSNGRHVPDSIDDDLYVEYPLDNMDDFPTNADEEDRMLMEAMLMSLKDLDLRGKDQYESLKTVSPNTDSGSTSTINGQDSTSNQVSPDTTSSSSVGLTLDTPTSHVESQSSTGTSTHNDTLESDTVDNTKATLTVEKNPTVNIMDGLMRRWDINFFRNK